MQDQAFRQIVERIKLRSPIEEIVGARVPDLRKKGALHWGRCPFHEERTPSFAVDPRRGTWRCYGACSEGGDAISFVQRFDGLSFLDALRMLGQSCGEEIPETVFRGRSKGDEKRFEKFYDVLSRAERFYAEKLWSPEGAQALAYARERGFQDDTLRAFGSGWAPSHGSPLLETARRSGIDEALLVETGLVRRADDGRPYDFFRGRWLVPIKDRVGRTVGFGGRHLPGDTKALGKYVNTPETRLFHKGRLVYGLHKAIDAVRKGRHLVLVEGYTDVMAAHQSGMEHVAAVLGTSTTEDHAALIRRTGASRVTLVFDGDEAGRRASLRALAGLLPLELNLDVASPAQGSDPCDMLLSEGGGERFGAMLDGAREWFSWLVDDLENKRGAELAEGVDELFQLMRRLSRPVEQDARLVELAGRLGLSQEALRKQWNNGARASEERRRAAEVVRGHHGSAEPEPEPPVDVESHPVQRPVDPRVLSAFQALLGAMLLDNSLIPVYGDWADRCPDADLKTVYEAVLELYENGEEGDPIHASAVMTRLADHPIRDRIVLMEESARTAESPMILARDQEAWLRRRMHERELARLKNQLSQTLQASPRSQEETEGAADLLQSLHEKLREGRVPQTSTPHTPANAST